MIRYGFLIRDNKIFDTKIQSYKLTKKFIDSNLIFDMIPNSYKRLYAFEPLLDKYSVDEVFKILRFNKFLDKQRKSETMTRVNKLNYMSNISVIYNYPPSFLTQKKFAIYKICQTLKKRLD